jgi:MSHA pilin protein MshC
VGFSRGFTIVEVVVVIVILGVLGLVVVSRFADSNSLNDNIARDQIVSLARIAQQASMGRADVTLTITPNASGNELELSVADDGDVIESATISTRGVSLSGDINVTDSCEVTPGASAISNGAPMTLTFEQLGNLGTSGVTGSTGAVTSALRICVNNSAVNSVCVSPSGFAYGGDCDA